MNPCDKCKRPMDLKCCHNCKKDAAECDVWHDCGKDCKEWEEPIQTNADRIRAMSDEELAKFIPDWSYTPACKCDEKPYVDCNNECDKCVLEWLKKPAEVDHE